jgi:hypothetical protein
MNEVEIDTLVDDISAIAEFGGMGAFSEAGRRYLKIAIDNALARSEIAAAALQGDPRE